MFGGDINLNQTGTNPGVRSSFNATPIRRHGLGWRCQIKSQHASTFTNMSDLTWAPRPPPEDIYGHLKDFFPAHDLDKPIIGAGSGSISLTGGSKVDKITTASSAHSKFYT